MLRSLIAALAVLLTVLTPTHAVAQWTRPDSGIAVYLVTAGPGGDFFTWFGHAAIVVADGNRNRDYWYDYGIIDGAWGTTAAHRTGRIRARVVRMGNPRRRLRVFEADDRETLVQELLLTPEQRAALVREMELDVRRFGRAGYDYRHIADNCATRIRDLIDRVSGGALRRAASMDLSDRTIREQGYRRFAVRSMSFTMLADVVTGGAIDRPMTEWDAMFLPEELARQVEGATLANGEPLAVERYRFASRHHAVPANPPHHHLPLALIGSGIALIALWLARAARRGDRRARVALGLHAAALGVALGVAGLVMAYGWTMTSYTFSHRNENVLLANPLVLCTVPLAIAFAAGSARAASWLRMGWSVLALLAVLTLLIKPIPGLDQDNWRVIALVLPVTLGMMAALWIATSALPQATESRGRRSAMARWWTGVARSSRAR